MGDDPFLLEAYFHRPTLVLGKVGGFPFVCRRKKNANHSLHPEKIIKMLQKSASQKIHGQIYIRGN